MSNNSAANFVALSDDLWGLGPKAPPQPQPLPQQQQQQMMMGGMAHGPPPPSPAVASNAATTANLVREIVQLKQFVSQMAQYQQMREAAGSTTDKYLMWIMIILAIIAFLFLVGLIVWWRRGRSVGLTTASPTNPYL